MSSAHSTFTVNVRVCCTVPAAAAGPHESPPVYCSLIPFDGSPSWYSDHSIEEGFAVVPSRWHSSNQFATWYAVAGPELVCPPICGVPFVAWHAADAPFGPAPGICRARGGNGWGGEGARVSVCDGKTCSE